MSHERTELEPAPVTTNPPPARTRATPAPLPPPPPLIEEGEAFMRLAGPHLADLKLRAPAKSEAKSQTNSASTPRADAPGTEHFDVIVIGAGQAGLSVGYHLARRGLRFVILDADKRVGDVWRRRWDSLRLFTPARFDGLDGMPFPAPPFSFPTKDEMADYLEAYAAHFRLPVRGGVKVDRLSKREGRYTVEAGDLRFEADQVVVAMATYQRPRVPVFARELAAGIVQLHSSAYRGPAQLGDGPVLIVGAGNSGAEIARELSRGHRVWLSGRDTGHVPFRIDGLVARLFLTRFLLRFLFHRVFTVRTPMGRRMRAKVLHKGTPLIRIKPAQLRADGVERAARVVGARDGLPVLEDGRVLDVASIVWCTGFDAGLSWIELPIFDGEGEPLHDSGVARAERGLYFVGQHFLHAMSSTMIHGVGRDAARIAAAVAIVAARATATVREAPRVAR